MWSATIVAELVCYQQRQTHTFLCRHKRCIPDPHTTNTKRASSQGPTGYFSSCGRYGKHTHSTLALLLQQKCDRCSRVKVKLLEHGQIYKEVSLFQRCSGFRRSCLLLGHPFPLNLSPPITLFIMVRRDRDVAHQNVHNNNSVATLNKPKCVIKRWKSLRWRFFRLWLMWKRSVEQHESSV